METSKKNIDVDGSKMKVAIIVADFHEALAEELVKNTKNELLKNRVKENHIQIINVPGALEIPFICKKVLEKGKVDAIIALAIVIRGETTHYELVTETTHQGLMNLQTTIAKIPIVFGILGCENLKQAKARTSGKGLNKGKQFAQAALLQNQTIKKHL